MLSVPQDVHLRYEVLNQLTVKSHLVYVQIFTKLDSLLQKTCGEISDMDWMIDFNGLSNRPGVCYFWEMLSLYMHF